MLKTIEVGSRISVQGIVEKSWPDGRLSVRVGTQVYTGRPVNAAA
ncbi:hypothetical protein [Pseudoprimorskyibacter insulae]|uniref:Uncharacterized protein n=1 Tax=Pseudoprimorskyibacter insulae TaxID=1695997 RepID=A0A2R8AU36_9RHOB|nr:hypothetical protein [Pseudoprimorskyibacter insulae]SPF79548.1 hypothetical protein PRI8871_01344 [Pseudoprimorskyibacter insulae]